MTKPVIVTRATKGAPLTRNELDNNFTNIDNATFSVTDGTNTKAFNLNDTLQFTAGTNISLAVNASSGAVTINNTQSAFDPTSPGAIGGTTANTIRGTTITATTQFSGPGTGLTGTASGLSIGGNAATATTATTATGATNINISTTDGNTSDTTMSVVLVGAQATGNQTPHIDAGLTYNASTNALTATTFVGTLSGSISQLDLNEATSGTWYPLFSSSNAVGTVYPGVYSNISYDATVGLTVPSLIASTTATTGALNLTFNPATASGTAINVTGKNSQGGAGYLDFLKITNTSTGATNPNKTFRINSTGGLEIVDSTYTNIRFALTDAGQMTVGGTNFPSTTGTTGQVLTLSSAGTAAWSTPSGSGTNQIVLYAAGGNATISLPYSNTTHTVSTTRWTLATAGGVSGVSVSGTNGTITIPAGTYLFELPGVLTGASTSVGDPELWDYTNGRSIYQLANGLTMTMAGSTVYSWLGGYGAVCVFSGSTNIGFALQSSSGSGTYTLRAGGTGQISSVGVNGTTANFVFKITKIA